MKYLKLVPTFLLAFLFLFGSINFFFEFVPPPPMSGNQALFFNLMVPTGFMKVVKILEIIGAILLLIPSKRALSLLILSPIALNILLLELLVLGGLGAGPLLIILIGIIAYQEFDKFKALL
ncbi:DoxX family protein [Aquirufa beregesia]